MDKKYAWVLLFFYTIFLGMVMYFGGVKYAVLLFGLSEEIVIKALSFSVNVETLSHIATVGVFVWAIWTFREQKVDKKKDDNLKRIKDISDRIIGFVGFSGFSLNHNSATILIAFLHIMRKEEKNASDEIKSEVALALTVVGQALKQASFKDVIGVDFSGGYYDYFHKLKRIYETPDFLKDFDADLYEQVYEKGGNRNSHYVLEGRVPNGAIRLHQIEDLIKLLFKLTDVEVLDELNRKREFADNAYFYPVIYSVYHFYSNGRLVKQPDGSGMVYFEDGF